MKEGHEIIDQVYAAKSDPDAADGLIRQYMGFIRAETAKFLNRPPAEGRDEEFSVAMLAFYESILGYEKGKGAFLSYSARGIRNRLIDHYRKERRHAICPLCMRRWRMTRRRLKIDMLEDSRNEIQALHDRSAVREEIDEFERKLLEFGISFPGGGGQLPAAGPHAGGLSEGACGSQEGSRSARRATGDREAACDGACPGLRRGEEGR